MTSATCSHISLVSEERSTTDGVSSVWTTDAGYLYVGNSNEPAMRFRLETGSDIVAQPGYRKPYVYVASMNGDEIGRAHV